MSDPKIPPPVDATPPRIRPAGGRPRVYPPPEFPPRRPALFARMPPAVFPPIMGLLGLGLALRRGLPVLGLPEELAVGLAETVLGIAVALWLFAITGYAVKLARRPGVLLEEMRALPGRAGLAAASLGLLLVAAALVPTWPALAQGALYAGLALHGGLAALVLWWIATAPKEARMVNPVWHLHFVGFIIGALSAIPLGLTGLATGLLWATVPVALLLWGIAAGQLLRHTPPAPLRPLLAIHLAPASLFATVAAGLGLTQVAMIFAAIAALIALSLLIALRWLVVSGFSALWGAFTFPLAAFCGALYAIGADVTATIFLAMALGLIPYVVVKVMQAWAQGGLAAKTNAAEA